MTDYTASIFERIPIIFDLTFHFRVLYYEIETRKINSWSKIKNTNKMETT